VIDSAAGSDLDLDLFSPWQKLVRAANYRHGWTRENLGKKVGHIGNRHGRLVNLRLVQAICLC